MLTPRLGDPLRFAWLAIALNTGIMVAAASFEPSFLFPLLFLPPLLLILPFRRTNAFYLRPFSNDESTGRLKVTIKKGLGWTFRLSGIRPPDRRTSTFWKYATYLVFCFRYSTPKHMSLEAGPDWLARLWRSLADARCAFVDLRGLTSSVVAELELVVECLGVRRVAFIGDSSKPEQEWRDLVAQNLDLDDSDAMSLQFLIWDGDSRARSRSLARLVRAFARGLPRGRAGLCPQGADIVRRHDRTPHSWLRSRLHHFTASLAGMLVVPLALVGTTVLIAYVAYRFSVAQVGDVSSTHPADVEQFLAASQAGMVLGLIVGLLATGLLIGGWLLASLWTYFWESGTGWGRAKATACFLYYLLIFTELAFAVGAPDLLLMLREW